MREISLGVFALVMVAPLWMMGVAFAVRFVRDQWCDMQSDRADYERYRSLRVRRRQMIEARKFRADRELEIAARSSPYASLRQSPTNGWT